MPNKNLNAVEVCEPTPISGKTKKSREDAGATKLARKRRPFEAPFGAQGKQDKQDALRDSGRAGATKMKTDKFDAGHVWKQLEDLAVPRLPLSVHERAVYSHLLRHSRLEEKSQLRFSIRQASWGCRLTEWVTRQSVRSLIAKGALYLIERDRAGHFVEVRIPEEIPSLHAQLGVASGCLPDADHLELLDFLETRALREAIHAREGGFCFYCLRRLKRQSRCIDHVVPRAQMGTNSYRNLVSCCMECNSLKSDRCAEDFLRSLYREGRFSSGELTGRLRALKSLAAGKMRPKIEGNGA